MECCPHRCLGTYDEVQQDGSASSDSEDTDITAGSFFLLPCLLCGHKVALKRLTTSIRASRPLLLTNLGLGMIQGGYGPKMWCNRMAALLWTWRSQLAYSMLPLWPLGSLKILITSFRSSEPLLLTILVSRRRDVNNTGG